MRAKNNFPIHHFFVALYIFVTSYCEPPLILNQGLSWEFSQQRVADRQEYTLQPSPVYHSTHTQTHTIQSHCHRRVEFRVINQPDAHVFGKTGRKATQAHIEKVSAAMKPHCPQRLCFNWSNLCIHDVSTLTAVITELCLSSPPTWSQTRNECRVFVFHAKVE